ncbi:MAG: DNA polymerase II large subunit [Candidatus Hodarchaeota archaeon]
MLPNASDSIQQYFDSIKEEIYSLYEIARKARKLGIDPETEPEIHPAEDVAARVEGLIGPKGVAERIRELGESMPREEIAFKIAEEIVHGKFGRMNDEKAADIAIRAALAILTEGITAGPIEGIAYIKIKANLDGTRYLAIYFSGPIRAAGGTETAQTVLVGDFVRKMLRLDRYKPAEEEIDRFIEEVEIYDKIMNLQYPATRQEREIALKNIPVEITGEATENVEVSVHRDLKRVETNQVRGGAVLVLNDGMIAKAPKLLRIVEAIGIGGWDWLSDLEKWKKEEDTISHEDFPRIQADRKYLADVIAGRPVFSHPAEIGGFRIRYGRSRNTGLAAVGINPATMVALEGFLAPGTHIRTEHPGKGAIVLPVDTIGGPIVRLKGGNVVRINSPGEARSLKREIEKILFLGDLLVAFGEFLENNHPLIPSGYCEEIWAEEVDSRIKSELDDDVAQLSEIIDARRLNDFLRSPFHNKPTAVESIKISHKLNIPLHPDYTYHWHDITIQELVKLREYLRENEIQRENDTPINVRLKMDAGIKEILEKICIPHQVENDFIVISSHAPSLVESLAPEDAQKDAILTEETSAKSTLEVLNAISRVKIRAKAPIYIGARMGRPEKAKERKMSPPIHSLFPIGLAGDKKRDIIKATKKQPTIKVDAVHRKCPKCGKVTITTKCPLCKIDTEVRKICANCATESDNEECPACGGMTRPYGKTDINIAKLFDSALKRMKIPKSEIALKGTVVKGVRGLTSKFKIPEPLEKGILRARHDIFVYKDGTVRFDATDAPLTHFTPGEVNTPVERLKELGYLEDYGGETLERPDQILELKPQDIVVPEKGAKYLIKVAKYVDDLLTRVYDLPAHYNVKREEDLIGHLVVGLAPHTSAGIIGRIVGLTRANVCYAHPYWHAAKRRNCVVGDQELPVYNTKTGEMVVKPIRDFVENALKNGAKRTTVDDFGTVAVENLNQEYRAVSLNPETGESILQPIKHWVKGTHNRWITITTATGRTLKMTPEHMALVYDPLREKFERKKAAFLEPGDFVPTLKSLPLPEIEPSPYVNVLKELSEKLPDTPKFEQFKHQVRLRNAGDWIRQKLREYIHEVQKDEKLTERKISLMIGKYFSPKLPAKPYRKPFGSDWYSSIPLSHLEVLQKEDVFSWDEIPKTARLGMARDDKTVSPYIPFTTDLLRLLGYYISEGYSRDRYGYYQTNFSLFNPVLRAHVERLIMALLGSKPYYSEDNQQLVHSGRIHTYLITYAWNAGSNAYNKRIPNFVYSLPKEYRIAILSSLIDGDGSIPKTDQCILFYSVSKKLLNDIGLLLLSLNVHHRPRKESAPARYGHKILARYQELGKEPKENIVHRISVRGPDLSILKELILKLEMKKKNAQRILSKGIPKEYIARHRKRVFRLPLRGNVLLDTIVYVKKSKESSASYCLEIGDNTNRKFYKNFKTVNCITGNCDGDEDTLILVLDALLNFSRSYLPAKRGGMMDAPLVISTTINPLEIDDEAHNMDTASSYPLEFYEKTMKISNPKDAEPLLDLVSHRLNTPQAYEGFKFSHNTTNINSGPRASAYKRFKTMAEKVRAQLKIAEKIRAVDLKDVAERIIKSHFIPDIVGNLVKFTKQQFRCMSCNAKFRRIPLVGHCPRCEGKIVPTVYQGGIKKYLSIAKEIIQKYDLPKYLSHRLEIIEMSINSLFEDEKSTQSTLSLYL